MTHPPLKRAAAAVPRLPIERFTLKCGATLLVSPREGAPVCAVQLHLRGGHSLDPAGREGTAYLTGNLVDQGTARHAEEEIAGLLEPTGGSLTGDSTGISGTVAGGDWKLLCELLCEMTLEPTYPRDKTERQRKRLVDRLTIEDDDPRSQATRLFKRLVYGDHWLGQPDYGTLATVPSIRRNHLVSFHKRNWCARRAVIAFCGDVDPQKVRRFLDRRLRGWDGGRDLKRRRWEPPKLEPRVGVFKADRQQVHVYLGHIGIRRRDADYAALVVMDYILGTGPGFTSRITRRLRDELGLAYTVSASISSSAGVLPGAFTAYIGTSPQHVATAIEGFLREIRRIQDEPVSPEELELAKSYLLGSFALGFERSSRRAQYSIFAERTSLGDDHLAELLAAFQRVTAEDVRRVARAHLHPDTPCVAAAGPITRRELDKIVRRVAGGRARASS